MWSWYLQWFFLIGIGYCQYYALAALYQGRQSALRVIYFSRPLNLTKTVHENIRISLFKN